MKNCNFASVLALSGAVLLTGSLLPSVARGQARSVVVEEIIARVNNDVITMSDYQKADEQLREEVAHDCQGCPQDKLMAEFKEQQKDLLRGLIDQSLMVQRAKDMGISVESDVIKRLDDVRKLHPGDIGAVKRKQQQKSGQEDRGAAGNGEPIDKLLAEVKASGRRMFVLDETSALLDPLEVDFFEEVVPEEDHHDEDEAGHE